MREDKEKRAGENRAKFGRSKAEKKLSKVKTEKGEKNLSDHKIDD